MTTRPLDQCNTDTCWLMSYISGLESFLLNTQGITVEFSTEYLLSRALALKAQRVMKALPNYPENRLMSLQGSFPAAFELISRYGLVPKSSWSGQKTLREINISYIIDRINEEIDIYRHGILNSTHLGALDQLINQALSEVEKIITQEFEYISADFILNGEYLTPQQYASLLLHPLTFGDTLRDRDDLKLPNPALSLPTSSTREALVRPEVDLDEGIVDGWQTLENIIIRQISLNHPVLAHGFWIRDLIDSGDGTIEFPPELTLDEVRNSMIYGPHGFLIVGYEIHTQTNQVEYLIVQNSQGELPRRPVLLRLHRSYFTRFLSGIAF